MPKMPFEIVSEISNVETIAIGSAIREVARLRKRYGAGRWRKLKGIALVRLANGNYSAPLSFRAEREISLLLDRDFSSQKTLVEMTG
jgi:hypothetical protein